MTIEEIFTQLSAHMVEGLMTHSQLSDYYGFLGLKGYQKCHEYHFFLESEGYKTLSNYYLSHYGKIIPEATFNNPNVIPESWYGYSRNDVTSQTRKSAIQAGMRRWVSWETQTKKLYEYMYQELIELNEIASAKEICEYIKDVDDELKFANQKLLELEAIDFDIISIMEKQDELNQKYRRKLKEMR